MADIADSYNPHGAALLAYFRGDTDAVLICHQDGKRDDVPAAFWFRVDIDPLERQSLDQAKGRVLDVGAGTGLHTLDLQKRGFSVTAIDVAAECVTIMKARGVRNACVADLYDFDDGPFDTIFCLCNGLDKVGKLDDLPRFLASMKRLLAPGGQLIADSFDMRVGASAPLVDEMNRKIAAGRYWGEMDLVFEFNGQRGAEFTVLQVDSGTLTRVARQAGWACDVLNQRGGHYLVRLCQNR